LPFAICALPFDFLMKFGAARVKSDALVFLDTWHLRPDT